MLVYANIIILNELLLLAYHILQVNDSSSLQLQIKEQLDVLRLKEVVLDHQLNVVFVVLVNNSVARAELISHTSDFGVEAVQGLLHILTFLEVGLGTFSKYFNLLLVLLDLLVHLVALELDGVDLGLRGVLFGGKDVFYFFEGLNLKEKFSFSFSDIKSVGGVLLVQFNQGLLEL
jgi:hypothetical protein